NTTQILAKQIQTLQGKPNSGKAKKNKSRQGTSIQVKARQIQARQGKANPGKARQSKSRQ
ncbi:hypothetical protein P7K49_010229, partial [Saguinus oedipus]